MKLQISYLNYQHGTTYCVLHLNLLDKLNVLFVNNEYN